MTYTIFQLPISNNKIFSSYNESNFTLNDYVSVWTDECDQNGLDFCEDLYTKFNLDRPKNFAGHSMSVSDLIMFSDEKTNINKLYYCSNIGFTDISNIIKSED